MLMRVKPARIEVIAPECFSVFSIRMAPKMMSRMSNVMTSPCTVDAATRAVGTCHTQIAIAADATYTSGMARRAGHLRPTSSTAASTIGRTATSAWTERLKRHPRARTAPRV